MSKHNATAAQESQVDKFREAAREAETDDREEAFDRLVKAISSAQKKPGIM